MFTTLIVKPIANLLVLIYALIPGHNFGLSIIIFTVVVRLLMWPLVKKQLHHAKAMRELQPELKRIKQAAKGNRQTESVMVMELYKERQINPFSSIGLIIVQFVILIALYSGLRKIVFDHRSIIDISYPFIRGIDWMKQLAVDIRRFDSSLLGVLDLSRAAVTKGQGIYWPALVLVAGSAITQYFQSKQLMPNTGQGRKLKDILKQASDGKKADQGEVNAAVGQTTRYFIPALIFLFTVNIAAAFSLYFLVSGLVALWQQNKVLNQSKNELTQSVGSISKDNVIEGEIIERPKNKNAKKTSKKTKRRK